MKKTNQCHRKIDEVKHYEQIVYVFDEAKKEKKNEIVPFLEFTSDRVKNEFVNREWLITVAEVFAMSDGTSEKRNQSEFSYSMSNLFTWHTA